MEIGESSCIPCDSFCAGDDQLRRACVTVLTYITYCTIRGPLHSYSFRTSFLRILLAWLSHLHARHHPISRATQRWPRPWEQTRVKNTTQRLYCRSRLDCTACATWGTVPRGARKWIRKKGDVYLHQYCNVAEPYKQTA